MTFEQKTKRIEQIVELLENGKASLEEVSGLFEEGVKLTKECFETLKSNQGKITVLQQELSKFIEKPKN